MLLNAINNNRLTGIIDRGSLTQPSSDVEIINILTKKIFREYTNKIHSNKPQQNVFIVINKTEQYESYKLFSNLTCRAMMHDLKMITKRL